VKISRESYCFIVRYINMKSGTDDDDDWEAGGEKEETEPPPRRDDPPPAPDTYSLSFRTHTVLTRLVKY